MSENGSNFKKGHTIRNEGSLVLGQEQDSIGGGFETAQSFKGMLSRVNVWDKVLTEAEIKNSKLCLFDKDKEGNVYKWPDFLNVGGVRLAELSPCKEVEAGMWNIKEGHLQKTYFFIIRK